MRRALVIGAACAGIAAAALAVAQAARPLIADLSSKQIKISTGFTGAQLLLFGSTDGAGDVVVVVRGPRRDEVVRRKERTGGIWINGRSIEFGGVPAYYHVASSRPLGAFANRNTLMEYRIGVATLNLPALSAAPDDLVREFRTALIRLKREGKLYSESPGGVTVMDGRLFRTEITFPATVPTGTYSAEVYLFRQGEPVGRSLTPITVRKVGLEAAIFEFAHRHAAIYGILAVIIALLAGWTAGVIFRRS
ncbi:MAG: TIGR02186 family protein [Alphaproteobacteria bacterium]